MHRVTLVRERLCGPSAAAMRRRRCRVLCRSGQPTAVGSPGGLNAPGLETPRRRAASAGRLPRQ